MGIKIPSFGMTVTRKGLSQSVLSIQDCEGERIISNDSPTVDLPLLVELLQMSDMVSMGNQFELLDKIIRQLTIPRALVNPLKAFWELIKQKTKSMPVAFLATAAVSIRGLLVSRPC
jgi:hypothetical protein